MTSDKRAFFIVLDSLGAGEAPDAEKFGDCGAHTLKSLFLTGKLHIPNLKKLGIGNITGLEFLGGEDSPLSSFGRMVEISKGKDTTTGHFELCGIVSDVPMPTYPHGFPSEIINEFSRLTGRGILCNKAYSGTKAIADYGVEHLETGDLIVYTSADSVFQIAAHEDAVPTELLYDYCKTARSILTGKHGVGRVIARPFKASHPFVRSENRRDFSLPPPRETLLDRLEALGIDRIGVGKIGDIFAHRSVGEEIHTHSDDEGMEATMTLAIRGFSGLCFVNLVDFDMKYGHRRDPVGYALALNRFDLWLGEFLPLLTEKDLLVITADHGCDPSFTKTTDHTREYVPLLAYRKGTPVRDLGTLMGFFNGGELVFDHLKNQGGRRD